MMSALFSIIVLILCETVSAVDFPVVPRVDEPSPVSSIHSLDLENYLENENDHLVIHTNDNPNHPTILVEVPVAPVLQPGTVILQIPVLNLANPDQTVINIVAPAATIVRVIPMEEESDSSSSDSSDSDTEPEPAPAPAPALALALAPDELYDQLVRAVRLRLPARNAVWTLLALLSRPENERVPPAFPQGLRVSDQNRNRDGDIIYTERFFEWSNQESRAQSKLPSDNANSEDRDHQINAIVGNRLLPNGTYQFLVDWTYWPLSFAATVEEVMHTTGVIYWFLHLNNKRNR